MHRIIAATRIVGRSQASIHRAWGNASPTTTALLSPHERHFSSTTTETAQIDLLPTSGLPPYAHVTPSMLQVTILDCLDRVDSKVDVFVNKNYAAVAANSDMHAAAILEEYDSLTRDLGHAWSMINHLIGVKNSEELRNAIAELQPKVVLKLAQLGQSQEIYAIWEKMIDDKANNVHGMGAVESRLVNKHLLEARLVGAGLSSKDREKFTLLMQESSKLSMQFQNNVIDSTKLFSMTITDPEEVKGMSLSLLQQASEAARQAAANATEQQQPQKQTEEVQDNFGGDDSGNTMSSTTLLPAYTATEGPWLFTLDGATVMPFMRTCPSAKRREEMQLAQFSRAGNLQTFGSEQDRVRCDNGPVMRALLLMRGKQAKLLGSYDNYAEVSLASKMAPDVNAVQDLLDRLYSRAQVSAKDELEMVREYAAKEGHSPLHVWDTAFYSEKLKEERFGVSDEVLRDYFPFTRVLDGMFATAERLYNVKVEQVENVGSPSWQWDPNVRLYQVRDGETGKHMADFFLDPFSRPHEKRGGAWVDVAVTPSNDPSTNAKRPVAIMVCNQQSPSGSDVGAETYMTWEEVLTLWHEFGHGLNVMLTTSPYESVAGINGVEWDAVELPSQFMENWCYHRGTLNAMTCHRTTGEQLPDDLFDKLIAARKHMSGWQLLRQVQLAEFDMELHKDVARFGAFTESSSDGEDAVDKTAHRVRDKYTLLLSLWPDKTLYTHFLHGFMHIFGGGYAAGYYSYLWAEVLSSDAFGAFEDVGLDDDQAVREVGMRMRHTIMASGGSRHPMELFREFRGREPVPDALFRHRGLE